VKSDSPTGRKWRRGNRPKYSAAFPAFLIFIFVGLTPAGSQAVSSLSRVEHIRTGAFDIYYPPSLAEEGKKLSTFADETLAELEAFFHTEVPGARIPILLSDSELDLNGYASPYPSNRIVIYLRGAGIGGQLASFADELRSVFMHELTHAVTLNMRGALWSFLSAAFGDMLAPVAWISPNAFVEGTAVWVESGQGREGEAEPAWNALPGTGRLNDPAALETVYRDIIQGKRRSLWEVSGVADHPGSGNLPYLYGALFCEFMEERYGADSLPALWRMASGGNFASGFDGTLTARGDLERLTGETPAALWNGFLDWLGRRAAAGRGRKDRPIGAAPGSDGSAGAAGGRIGAFCADGDRLSYLDLEKKAVFSLTLDGESAAGKPLRLFAADGYLEDMRFSADGTGLEIDWVRAGPKGRLVPARYFYDFGKGKLSLVGDRELETAGAAMANLLPGAPPPFLHQSRLDPASGYRFGLVRMGTRSMPARVSPEGGMEILASPLIFIRSLSLEGGSAPASAEARVRIIALSFTLPGDLSRIALLEEMADGWSLRLQSRAPEGGAGSPVLAGRTKLVYRAELGEGRQELRAVQVAEAGFQAREEGVAASWLPLEAMRAALSSGAGPEETESVGAAHVAMKPVLFPRLFTASRYPYLEEESAGLIMVGSDLTERLAWQASAGWNFAAALPEASILMGLTVDRHYLSCLLSDTADAGTGTVSPTRVVGAGLGHSWNLALLPLHKRLRSTASVQFAGLKTDYSLAGYPSLDFDYVSVGGSMRLRYSTMNSLPFSPFDTQGIALSGGLDYELLPHESSAFSFSGSLSLALPRPTAILSLYGAISPPGDLRFHPSGRYFSAEGGNNPSAIAAPYPEFREYRAMGTGSPWYGFAELETRLATLELWKTLGPVRMPWLPSWTLRRVSLWGGMRAAALERDNLLALPYSAFARLEFDAALLAGLAAEGHIALHIEAAWAFVPSLAAGQVLHMDLGFGVTL